MDAMRIDVWSDVVCPWCYIGKRRLEAALARFPQRTSVEVIWRAYELDPSAPRIRDANESYAARLAKKYGTTVATAEERIRRVVDVAAADGLTFRFDHARPGNTFDAHRLLHLAAQRGVQDAVKERFFLGYMTEGEAIGDRDTLSRLARDAGLDTEDVSAVLATDDYARDVRADEEEARALGIGGVPFFVFGGSHAVSGAQPASVILEALTAAWTARESTAPSEGAACGPEGCV